MGRISDEELEYRQKLYTLQKTMLENNKLKVEIRELRRASFQRWVTIILTFVAAAAGVLVTYLKNSGVAS